MKDNKIKNAIKLGCFIMMMVLLLIAVVITIVQYNQEGEKNMPFELSKITIISTANGIDENPESLETKWKMNLLQNNDVYFSITKNENFKEELAIESVKIENIQILEAPKQGEIKAYMPNSSEGSLFTYKPETEIIESLEYRGGAKNDTKTLEIANRGGNMVISFANIGLGTYESNDEIEIKHDGSLLQKAGKTIDDLKCKVSFDLILKVKGKNYKTNIKLDLPCGDLITRWKKYK